MFPDYLNIYIRHLIGIVTLLVTRSPSLCYQRKMSKSGLETVLFKEQPFTVKCW